MRAADRTSEPLVSFLIPVLNDADNLARCLKAIEGQSSTVPVELIVLDNGSTDGSEDIARASGATVLQIPRVRVSALRNEGIRVARAPWIALVDADNEIAPGWLSAAVRHFASSQMAALGCDYSAPPDGTWVQQLYDAFRHHPRRVESVRWLATGNLVVRRDLALAIGGFDETLETCEDVDFCNRLRRRGYEIWADPNMASTHFGDPTTLNALFRGELWRGRDALRVDLRGITAWADLPSMVLPIIELASMMVALITVPFAWLLGRSLLRVTLASLMVVPALSCLKAIRLRRRMNDQRLRVARLYIVALVYDLARAWSLVIRMPHRRASRA
jgi:glycosyltransferase involved in cell wall biosynthesis